MLSGGLRSLRTIYVGSYAFKTSINKLSYVLYVVYIIIIDQCIKPMTSWFRFPLSLKPYVNYVITLQYSDFAYVIAGLRLRIYVTASIDFHRGTLI